MQCKWILAGCLAAFLAAGAGFAQENDTVAYWMTGEAGDHAMSPGPAIAWRDGASRAETVIEVTPDQEYQSILGMGASLEHASLYNLTLLDEATRNEVLRKLLDPVEGIGMNLMRVCIGAADFIKEPYYSYNDLPEGETDPELKHFDIGKDRDYLLPLIKKAREFNPDLLYFASPWSPPGWMKTTGSMKGGELKREHYDVYARYLVRFIEAYEAEGVPIHAITPQNEPQHVDPDYPTCLWTGEQQRDFIRDYLGPRLREAGLDTRIWCWDHNFNDLDFPRAVLSDPEAAKFVDGTAFHHYNGSPDAMSVLREEFPDKHLYFTEGSTFRTRGALQIINFFRNWARTYNAWVFLLDENREPNRGPHHASRTCIELNTESRTVEYHFDYYMYGQFMKFVPRGSVRIGSSEGERLFNNVAFRDPEGRIVLVVANASSRERAFDVVCNGRHFSKTLPGRALATFRF